MEQKLRKKSTSQFFLVTLLIIGLPLETHTFHTSISYGCAS